MMALKIKVCGMRDPKNIQELIKLPVDLIGFICYEKSKRFIDHAHDSFIQAISDVEKVGVFVNASKAYILSQIKNLKLTHIQLHGSESPSFCQELKEHTDVKIIKAFGIDEQFNWSQLTAFPHFVDYFLFDTKSPNHGGTGIQFNWDLLKNYSLNVPYFLSGGIDAESIFSAVSIEDPRLYALDLNSKFEIEPGLKDINLLNQTLNSIK